MLEQETERIIATVCQRTIGAHPTVTVKDLIAADIPYPLKTFFRVDVESMLAAELQRQRKSSRFNYDHTEVQILQQQMNPALVLHYSFDRADFLQRLGDTVHLVINYLIRPQWTLTSVLFEKDEAISSNALKDMLRYFGPYEYLKGIIIRYAQDKNKLTFTRQEFSTILWKIDGEYIRRKTGDELARVMSSMYDFLQYPNPAAGKALPVKALVRFFEDKGLSPVISRLEGEYAQNKHELMHHELSVLLEDVRREEGPFVVERLEPQGAPVASGPREAFAAPAQRPPAATIAPSPGLVHADLLSAIGASDSRKFIRKLFNEDELAFQSKLRALNHVATWREASKVIDEIFIDNDVDPYCSEAEKFIEVIFEQYHPNK